MTEHKILNNMHLESKRQSIQSSGNYVHRRKKKDKLQVHKLKA